MLRVLLGDLKRTLLGFKGIYVNGVMIGVAVVEIVDRGLLLHDFKSWLL